MMRKKGNHKILKSVLSGVLALLLVLSAIPGTFQIASEAAGATVYCDVRFSMPAICCDVGDVIDLTKCGVQFSAQAYMVKSSIAWTYNGAAVNSFTPSKRGVYSLTAKSGSYTKTIYVVAKNPEETEYVLYRNDFNAAPTNFRVQESSNGGVVSTANGNYIMDASASGDAYIRVLLPKFLDAFGDLKITANMKITNAVDPTKWASLMYRVQKEDYPYYHTCIRSDASAYNGVEIAQRNSLNQWEIYRRTSFDWFRTDEYNLCTITSKGTRSVVNINGYEVADYGNTAYASGSMGFQTRGTKVLVDYVEVTLTGNANTRISCDVSYAKPAIRADIGDTIDLSGCDVQFKVNELYTKGSTITWKKDGKQVSTLTPTQPGVTTLTATSGDITKNIYVVTRNLNDGEYVLYSNEFDISPSDFRVVQSTESTASVDHAGHYVLNAATSKNAYCRVLLPEFLDEFGDGKLIAYYQDTNPVDEKKWTALMGRVQNKNFPYIQFCVRNNATLDNGVEITEKLEETQNVWSVRNQASTSKKYADDYNLYELAIQNNYTKGYINGTEVISYDAQTNVNGGWGFQTRGTKMIIDYVKFTLGETTAQEDTAVAAYVSKARPAIGCNAGQTVLLTKCPVQFTAGTYPVDGSQITWRKDGKVITEFSDTSVGIHTLTATHGHTTMNVYVVAKKTTASEYRLYTNSFDQSPTDLRIVEALEGGKTYYRSEGTFALDATAGQQSYARVLLPEFLDEFGDVTMHASIMLTSALDSAKWGSLTFRTQPDGGMFNHALIRYDSTVANGVEFAVKNSATPGDWTVLTKAAAGVKIGDTWREVMLKAQGKDAEFYVSGTKVASYDKTPFTNGGWGFMVRSSAMLIDWVKVYFKENNTALDFYNVAGGYVDVRDPSTGLVNAPSMVTDVKTKAELNKILTNSPAVAIMNFDAEEGVPMVVFSDGKITAQEALKKLGSKVIPAFRITTKAQAENLAIFLRGNSIRDAYAVSTDPEVLKHAFNHWKYIRGVLDCSAEEQPDLEALRVEALTGRSKVLILPETVAGGEVTELQDLFSTVWMTVSEGKTATAVAINKGVYGIITPNRAVTEGCITECYTATTQIRTPVVVGQMGNPSKAPENTIIGAQSAFNYGANGVEMDIYRTSDNVAIVMHDETLDRTTNGTGKVTGMTMAQIQQYKVDYYSGVAAQAIPTLEEYFTLVKGHPEQKLFVDLKTADTELVKLVIALIKKYDMMQQVVIISAHQYDLDRVYEQLPGVANCWTTDIYLDKLDTLGSTEAVLEYAQTFNCVYSPDYNGWGKAIAQEVAHRGVSLWPRNVNTQSAFDLAWISGVEGIYTESPQWAADYIESLTWNTSDKVIATTYDGDAKDVTGSAEIVIVEDTLGVTTKNGTITIPNNVNGGMVSFYYRYKVKTTSGTSYYVASEVRTMEVEGTALLQLNKDSKLALKNGQLVNVTDKDTVAAVKAQFKYPVVILNKNGGTMADTAIVPTGATVCLVEDGSESAVVVMRGDVNGDGMVNTTDYVRIKSYFLKKVQLTGAYESAADCDGDNKITTADYLRVKSYLLKKLDLFA